MRHAAMRLAREALTALGLALAALLAAGPAGAAEGPDLEVVLLGKDGPPEPVGVRHDDGSWTVKATGHFPFRGFDDGGFAHLATEAPNFTFVARVAEAPQGARAPRFGIAVRAGAGRSSRMVAVRCDGSGEGRRLQCVMRYGVARDTHDGSGRTSHRVHAPGRFAANGLWLKVVRRYPVYHLYASRDGEQWTEVGTDYTFTLLAQKVLVGLLVTAGKEDGTVAVRFDHIRFTQEGPVEAPLTRAAYAEYRPPMQPWQMFLTQADSDKGTDTQSIFLLKPKSLAAADIRALVYSTGSKEIMLAGRRKLEWDKGSEKRRKPKRMPDWEGTWEIPDLRAWYQILGHYRLARVGGALDPKYYDQAIRELAEQTGMAHLPNLPVVATGASFAGGWTARAARLMPERMIAAAPGLIGMAGADTEDPAVLGVPHLHVFGSKDTGGQHLKQAVAQDAALRRRGARWAQAPMWWVYHRWHSADQVILPYFLRCIDLRVPAGADPSAGPVALKRLDEADGYLGLNATWDTSDPQVVPFKEADEATRRGDVSWLPDEYTARVWRVFVSNWPKTVIQFPRFDGNEGFSFTRPEGRVIHFMEAGVPFNLLACGPFGKDVTVEYWAGLKRLKVLRRYRDNPYLVQLEPLPPGLHVLHAITTVDGKREISRPAPILFQRRWPGSR
ncbi:MAG: hypothetical protein R6X20_13845 [Phycisphaerae bacterium]